MTELTKIRLASATGDLYDGLLASFSLDSKLPKKLAARTAAFQEELARWREFSISHSVPELIWLLYRETGYYDYVGGLKGGLLRQANLRMLADRAAEFERSNYRGLFRFLLVNFQIFSWIERKQLILIQSCGMNSACGHNFLHQPIQ